MGKTGKRKQSFKSSSSQDSKRSQSPETEAIFKDLYIPVDILEDEGIDAAAVKILESHPEIE